MKWFKKGREIYKKATQEGWRLIEKPHDGIIMPEHWERRKDGEWEFRDAYNGGFVALGPNGEKMFHI